MLDTPRCLRVLVLMAALGPAAPGLAEELPTFDLEMKDGVLVPSELRVPAGVTFKIVLRNTGSGPAEFDSQRLRKEKVLGPGAESFITVRKLSPGSYEFYEEFNGDKPTAHGVIVAE
jgi:hypothetical protein